MVEIIVPDGQTREEYFVATARVGGRRRQQKHDSGTYRWYRIAHMFIYFGLFFVFVTQVLELVIAGGLCHTSDTYENLHTVLELLSAIFIAFALVALLRTYSQFAPLFRKLNLLRTFWVYKGIVLLYMLETIIIAVVEAADAAQPTRYMSEADFTWGVHAFMVACQSCIFSFGYVAMLSGLRYRRRSRGPGYVPVAEEKQGADFSIVRLLLAILLPTEPFSGFWTGLKMFFGLFRGRKGFDYTAGTGVGHEERVAKDDATQDLNLDERSSRYSNYSGEHEGA